MNIFRWAMVCCIFAPALAFASTEKLFHIAPSQLPHTGRQMHTAGFWVSRHPSPDKIIMAPAEITAFNARTQDELKLTKDIFAAVQNFQTESLLADFEKTLKGYTDKGYYTADGGRDLAVFMEAARQNMNLSAVVLGVAPQYGLVVHYADVRFLPTAEGLYETAGDFDFDQLQNSSLDIGNAVAVVHQSADKQWYYVISALSDGWVKAQDVAIGDEKAVRDFVQSKDFAVVIKPKADIFLNARLTGYYDYMRMGARLPLALAHGSKVLVPTLGADNKLQLVPGYVNSSEFHAGYLPYTARTIYFQAFAMLNQPYGWGGMRGEQDCSAFLDEVFGTVGIILPRDSKDQAQLSDAMNFDEKITLAQKVQALKTAQPGGAILPMKGHILLYLGMVEDKPYAIHAIWAFRERKGGQDVPRVVSKVTVSDLDLGEGSQKGSLLKRLTKIVEIK